MVARDPERPWEGRPGDACVRDMTVLTELLLILGLVLLNGVFALAEIALVSARSSRLKELANKGRRGAARALRLAEAPGRFLATVQVGITLVGVLAGAFGGATLAGQLAGWMRRTAWLQPYAEELSLALVVALISYLSLVLGELVPKRIALTAPERFASFVAPPVSLLSRIAAPAVWVLERSTWLVTTLLRIPPTRTSKVSEDELRLLLREAVEEGVLERNESSMVERVLNLDRLPVGEIMTPRAKLTCLDVADSHETIWHKIVVSGHSHFPVYEGNRDNIVGIVSLKAIYANLAAGLPVRLRDLMTQPLIVPEHQRVLQLLETFRRSSQHIALVADEFGQFIGLVTLIDVMEAIAGDFPRPDERLRPTVKQRHDGSLLADGAIEIERLAEHLPEFPFEPPEDRSYHTLAGFLLERMGRIPSEGDTYEERGYGFEVIDMDRQRIDKVLIYPPGVERLRRGN